MINNLKYLAFTFDALPTPVGGDTTSGVLARSFMKEIKLTQGKVALVDDEDYDKINLISWHSLIGKTNTYAIRSVSKNKKILMHRFILGVSNPKIQVDHEDGNGLNNQRENLRIATNSQNCANRKIMRKSKTSKFRGVTWNKGKGKWDAKSTKDGVTNYIGRYVNEVDAAVAYNIWALKNHGKFANLNIINNDN